MAEGPRGVVVRRAESAGDRARLHDLRTRVFVGEQGVPPETERDALDDDADHVLAETPDGEVIGTGRLVGRPDGTGVVGRMAVAPPLRGQGVGASLLAALEDRARERGLEVVELHAQAHALAFYERAGYSAYGESFLEAGIEHVHMRKPLT